MFTLTMARNFLCLIKCRTQNAKLLGRVDMSRPLCPYPQVAQYKGVGSTNDAANFVCKAPARASTN